MTQIRKCLLIFSASLCFTSLIHTMDAVEEDDELEENSGLRHTFMKYYDPKPYVCNPKNNLRYDKFTRKIDSTSIDKLRQDPKFWDEYKRYYTRMTKLLEVAKEAILTNDIDTLTLLCTYNCDLPDALALPRKALAESKIRIDKALKKDGNEANQTVSSNKTPTVANNNNAHK